MKETLEKLLAEYSEFHVDSNRMTFTQKNWTEFAEAVEEKAVTFDPNGFELMGEGIEYWKNLEIYAKENMTDELIKDKVILESEVARLKEELESEKKVKEENFRAFEETKTELNEFVESGWEANGNKLYLKGEQHS